jgi:hypothetical protein
MNTVIILRVSKKGVAFVLPSASEEGFYCVSSRCRDSSVGTVTTLRAGLSRYRSVPGRGNGGQRQAAVEATNALER